MTNWTITRCPNLPGGNEDESAYLDDGVGAAFFPGWFGAWEYIAGNTSPGDTVTVLDDDMRI